VSAASSWVKDAPFPWGGYVVNNDKGCYLANFNVSKPCGDCTEQKSSASNDGGFFPVKVTSYYPNQYGLYCMSGNVAEMIAEPGKAKGGSWQDNPDEGRIKAVKTCELPSPAVGFRVFMEIIEE
jgi:Formylglycine-generating sulfatase enzyme.